VLHALGERLLDMVERGL